MLYQYLDQLTPLSTLADLPVHKKLVSSDAPGIVVANAFDTQPDLPGVIVINGQGLLGVISRRSFLEKITHPYGPEVYLGRKVEILFDTTIMQSLKISATCHIQEAAQVALDRPPEQVYEPVVVEGSNGVLSLLDVYVLLLAQSKLLSLAGTIIQQQKETAESANRELQIANERLKELDQLKTDFLSTVSHELRTPLTSVLGFAKIIKKRLDQVILPHVVTEDKELLRALHQIRENTNIIAIEGERLTALINDVLDIAKMEAGKIDWKKQPLSIGEVVEQALAATAALFVAKELTQVVDIPPNLPPVLGDRDRLIQVVINLISNAVKFTDRGMVICQVKHLQPELVVSVIDTGIGIKPEEQAWVFEKFKQVGDTLTNRPKGTGLGLAISRQIVEHHGGRIWVESRPNQGSSFSFTLPIPVFETLPM